MPRGMVDFLNPCSDECPQTIVCHYFGDIVNKPSPPLHCCNKCNPEILGFHVQKVNTYEAAPSYCQPQQKCQFINTLGKSYPEMTKELKDKAYLELVNHWHLTWRSRPFSFDEPSYISLEIIVMDSNLSNLATNLHKVSSHKRFDMLVQSWVSIAPLLSEELDSLWKEVQTLNDWFGKEMEELKKSKQSGVKREKGLVGLGKGHNKQERDEVDGVSGSNVKIDEAIVTSMTVSMVIEGSGAVLEVEGPQKRN